MSADEFEDPHPDLKRAATVVFGKMGEAGAVEIGTLQVVRFEEAPGYQIYHDGEVVDAVSKKRFLTARGVLRYLNQWADDDLLDELPEPNGDASQPEPEPGVAIQ